MKKLKPLAFLIGFMMLLCLPSDTRGILFYIFLWFPAAIGLIAYSGAFKKKTPEVEERGNSQASGL